MNNSYKINKNMKSKNRHIKISDFYTEEQQEKLFIFSVADNKCLEEHKNIIYMLLSKMY